MYVWIVLRWLLRDIAPRLAGDTGAALVVVGLVALMADKLDDPGLILAIQHRGNDVWVGLQNHFDPLH